MKVHYKDYYFISRTLFTKSLTLHSWIGILKTQLTFYFNFIKFRSPARQHTSSPCFSTSFHAQLPYYDKPVLYTVYISHM